MKLLLILFIFTFSLYADEMKRIEAIVSDITKLRTEYEGCQTELKIYEMKLKNQKDENKILHQELNSFKNLYKKEIDYKNKIKTLKNTIQKQNLLLKSKDNIEKNPIVKKKKITKIKEKDKNNLENIVLVKCEEPNLFPELVMKKEPLIEDKKVSKKQKQLKEKIENFKASAFRLNKNADIYNDVNGKVVEEWSQGTSFTSSIKTQNWVKITGYFVDKVWMRSSKDIWVKLSDVIKR